MSDSPIEQITELYLFPYYKTREDYKAATGNDAPAYLSYKPRKYWFDPQAKTSAQRYVTYDHALVMQDSGYSPAVGPDNRPFTDQLILAREDAASVNIPPTVHYAPGQAPTPAPEVQPPLRALQSNETLDFAFGGAVIVKRTDLLDAMAGGFTNADRQLLQAIAAKLGV